MSWPCSTMTPITDCVRATAAPASATMSMER